MANNCYSWAYLTGSKEALDTLEVRLGKAIELVSHLWYETFYEVLNKEVPQESEDTYDVFGTRWFHFDYERDSETTATLSGDSAWSPPLGFFLQLSEVYQLKIESDYCEEGNDIAGYYNCDNGEVTRDESVSSDVFRYREMSDSFMQDRLESIEYGDYDDSLDDPSGIGQEVWQIMSDTDKEEISNAMRLRRLEIEDRLPETQLEQDI